MKKIRCMKELEIFSALDFAERERIGALARKRVYRKNEFIFREGEPADTIYLIKYGRVKLFKVSSEGREIILDILKEDDMFGENTFFEDTVHTMSAQAMEDTFVCSCSREDFAVLLKNPQISLKIIQLLGKKLNDYTDQVANMAFPIHTPEELLAAFPQGAETTCQAGGLKMTAGEAGKLLKAGDFPFKSAEEVAETIVDRAGL
ncbi:CRP/FNR family transcriptional regulator, anaerobic regulatory protein [Desulfofundulus australicus DSM 11792]|uniref:CRP/FNR family transcriptional regulator, anaerobic regulatory protein n=1 Tax=Desulfofundulus australicus DSM 11792 TaxID=1121425 RepID=A0A1M4S8R2_9FIRM|nr:MTH865 family protein [Desulfofundulus australicus]SHE28590.1 CRP/FNR family transcriptional regulator, anaerobic regulatory protein [Desulfofundulus australicus DSM 11792]